jgi:hypothetical protein
MEAAINSPDVVESPFAKVLREAWTSDRPHHHRLILSAAVIATALQKQGMQATLVGGGAIELHAPDVYRTGDIDFVVVGRPRSEVDTVMQSLGLTPRGRHWIMDDLFVEVPSTELEFPFDVRRIGDFDLRVVSREGVLVDRINGFRHWKYWGGGMQAIVLLRAFGECVDEKELRRLLRREGAEHAYELLRAIADSDEEITVQRLDALWHTHYR